MSKRTYFGLQKGEFMGALYKSNYSIVKLLEHVLMRPKFPGHWLNCDDLFTVYNAGACQYYQSHQVNSRRTVTLFRSDNRDAVLQVVINNVICIVNTL